MSWPGQLWNLIHAAKPRYADRLDHANGLLTARLEPRPLEALRGAASAWDVSVNDLFLAAMARALEPLAAGRLGKGRRDRLGLDIIADLRGDLPASGGQGLGLLLGSFCVFHKPADGLSLRDLADRLSRQTRRAKRRRVYMRTLAELRAAHWVMGLASPDRQQKFYRQHYAQWGGISNLNLDAARQPPPPAQGYRRAVSTGPICPVVWAVTTFHGGLDVSLSFRRTVLDLPAARQCLGRFLRCLGDL